MPGAYLLTLGAGLDALVALRQGPLRLSALSERLGRNSSATYRIVHTLMQHGFVAGNAAGEYELTTVLWELGAASLPVKGLHAVGQESAERLVARFGESVNIATYNAGRAVFVVNVDGTHPIRMVITTGSTVPAHCVAAGKVLIAYRPWTQVERDLALPLRQYTNHTIVDLPALRAELEVVRAQGYAVSDGEWRTEICGISVPVRDHTENVIASLGVSGPAERVRSQCDTLTSGLKEAALNLEGRLGGMPVPPSERLKSNVRERGLALTTVDVVPGGMA